MPGPPCVGCGVGLAATVYAENCGELAKTSYGARASLPTVPDAPRTTATWMDPFDDGRLTERPGARCVGAGVVAWLVVTQAPATTRAARVRTAKAIEEATRRARRVWLRIRARFR